MASDEEFLRGLLHDLADPPSTPAAALRRIPPQVPPQLPLPPTPVTLPRPPRPQPQTPPQSSPQRTPALRGSAPATAPSHASTPPRVTASLPPTPSTTTTTPARNPREVVAARTPKTASLPSTPQSVTSLGDELDSFLDALHAKKLSRDSSEDVDSVADDEEEEEGEGEVAASEPGKPSLATSAFLRMLVSSAEQEIALEKEKTQTTSSLSPLLPQPSSSSSSRLSPSTLFPNLRPLNLHLHTSSSSPSRTMSSQSLFSSESKALYGTPTLLTTHSPLPYLFLGTTSGNILRLEPIRPTSRSRRRGRGRGKGNDGFSDFEIGLIYGGRVTGSQPVASMAISHWFDSSTGRLEGRILVSYFASARSVGTGGGSGGIGGGIGVLLWDLRRARVICSVGNSVPTPVRVSCLMSLCFIVSDSDDSSVVLMGDANGSLLVFNQKSGKTTNLTSILLKATHGALSPIMSILSQPLEPSDSHSHSQRVRLFILTSIQVIVLEYRVVNSRAKIVVLGHIPIVTPSETDEIPYGCLLSGADVRLSNGVIGIGYGSSVKLYRARIEGVRGEEENEAVYVSDVQMEILMQIQVPPTEKVIGIKSSGDVILILTLTSPTKDNSDLENSEKKKIYILDSFDYLNNNFIQLKSNEDDSIILPKELINLTYATFQSHYHLYHSALSNPLIRQSIHTTSKKTSWDITFLGTNSILSLEIPGFRSRLLNHYFCYKGNKDQDQDQDQDQDVSRWIQGFEILCYDYFHGLPLMFGNPSKEEIGVFAIDSLFRFLGEKMLVRSGNDVDIENDNENDSDTFSFRLEKVFGYLVHMDQVEIIFSRLYNAVISYSESQSQSESSSSQIALTTFYRSLFSALESDSLRSVPTSHLDEFFEFGGKEMAMADFASLLTKLDITGGEGESSLMIEKLIEKCRLLPELYGCYVSVQARGKGDFLTPLGFLMERLRDLRNGNESEETQRHCSMIRRELLHVLRFAYQSIGENSNSVEDDNENTKVVTMVDAGKIGVFREVLRFLFMEAMDEICIEADILQQFLGLVYRVIRQQYLRKPLYESHVACLIRSDPKHDSEKIYLAFLALLLHRDLITIRSHELLESILEYLLLVDTTSPPLFLFLDPEPSLNSESVAHSLLVKTDPQLEERYRHFIALAKSNRLDSIVVLLCSLSGAGDEIIRKLLMQPLSNLSDSEMDSDVDFLFLFEDRIRWIYEELIEKLRRSEIRGIEIEQFKSQIFLQKFLTRIIESNKSQLLDLIIDDEEFHIQYIQLLVNNGKQDQLVAYLKANYDRLDLEGDRLKRLVQIVAPIMEARTYVACRLGNIEEAVECIMQTIGEKKMALVEFLSSRAREIEEQLKQVISEDEKEKKSYRFAAQYLILLRGIEEESRVMQRESIPSFVESIERFEGVEENAEGLDVFSSADSFDPLSVCNVHFYSPLPRFRRRKLRLPDIRFGDDEDDELFMDVLRAPAYLELRRTLLRSLKQYVLPSTRQFRERDMINELWFSFLHRSFLQPLIELQYALLGRPIPVRRTASVMAMMNDEEEEEEVDDGMDSSSDSDLDASVFGNVDPDEELNPVVRLEVDLKKQYDRLDLLNERLRSIGLESSDDDDLSDSEEEEDERSSILQRQIRVVKSKIERIHAEITRERVAQERQRRSQAGGSVYDLNKLANLYLQRCFVDCVQIVMKEMKSCISPSLIRRGLVQEYGYVRVMQLRPLLASLLLDIHETTRLTDKIGALLATDASEAVQVLHRDRVRAVYCESWSSVCQLCSKAVDQSQLNPHIVVLRCGHVAHDDCCRAIGGERILAGGSRRPLLRPPLCPKCHGGPRLGRRGLNRHFDEMGNEVTFIEATDDDDVVLEEEVDEDEFSFDLFPKLERRSQEENEAFDNRLRRLDRKLGSNISSLQSLFTRFKV